MIAATLADIPNRGRIRRDSEIAPTAAENITSLSMCERSPLFFLEDHECQVIELFGFALKFDDLIVYGTTYCLRAFVSKADGGIL